MTDKQKQERTWTEEIEVAANEVVDQVKKLIQEGNVRRLIIREPDGDVILEVPLTAGAVVGSVLVFFAPVLAAVGAMAALLTRVKIEIVRTDAPEGGETRKLEDPWDGPKEQ